MEKRLQELQQKHSEIVSKVNQYQAEINSLTKEGLLIEGRMAELEYLIKEKIDEHDQTRSPSNSSKRPNSK